MTTGPSVAVICGGVGAARLLRGLQRHVDPDRLTAIANVADDMVLHGLHISPDLDTIVYTVADAVSTERGWGLEGETWQAMTMLGRYGGEDWFSLGDRDLGTHLHRTQRRAEGATLSEVTAEIAAAWGIPFRLLPVSDDPIRTMVDTVDGERLSFQTYFVGRRHDVAITGVEFVGITDAAPAPGVLEAIASADRIVVAPSNPVVSIDPVLDVPGVRAALAARRDDVVAVSPIVGGAALKGPADRMLTELGRSASVAGVAAWYAEVVGTLVVDTVDGDAVDEVEALGMACVAAPTIMSEPGVLDSLSTLLLDPLLRG